MRLRDTRTQALDFRGDNVDGVLNKYQGSRKMEKKLALSISSKRENLKAQDCNQMALERSLSFKNWEMEKSKLEPAVSLKFQGSDFGQLAPSILCTKEGDLVRTPRSSDVLIELISPRPRNELDAAAVKLQKYYKGHRTRRNLADCAVVVEELWWKALDSADLERSSVSFFKIEKPQTAVSRWSRARTRAAKVGKGLSKDDKAQKLALQHWLEAIDPRHRYGHNLHLYYIVWFDSESTQPFFYWLDIGDGKEINLEKCPRSKLHHQCIQYLGPNEREEYEVIVKDGLLMFKKSKLLVDTFEGSKWIFVLSTSRTLYIGQKKKGTFQHSSFLSGGATTAAGRLVAEAGVLQAIWPYSGHYLPTEDNFKEFMCFLTENNIDLTNVKKYSVDDDQYPSYSESNEKSVAVAAEDDGTEIADVSRGDAGESAKESTSTQETQEETIADEVVEPLFEFSNPLPCKWSTGAGPRIGCVRDYPADLQSKALEQVNLSPRVIPSPVGHSIPIPSPRPSPGVRVSPRLAYMGMPSPRYRPRVSLALPSHMRR